MKIIQLSILTAIILMAISCSPKVQTTAPATAVLTPEMETGKKLMEGRCTKCHKLHEPTEFSAEKWNRILDKMQPKAKITDNERASIYAYVTHR